MAENSQDARSLLELFLLIRQVPVPVVAAVTGRALAGGCGLATACDIVLASASARFGYPEVKIGFVPAMVTAILRRNVSEKRAFELLTRGEEISAPSRRKRLASSIRFSVMKVLPPRSRLTSKGSQNSASSAIALTKGLLYQIDGLGFVEALETGADVNVIARMSEDCQKGIAAFLNHK